MNSVCNSHRGTRRRRRRLASGIPGGAGKSSVWLVVEAHNKGNGRKLAKRRKIGIEGTVDFSPTLTSHFFLLNT